jgi:syntaxin 1B/2/3
MASYNQYARYSGNPYEIEGQGQGQGQGQSQGQTGGYGSNPYGTDGGNPYGGSYGQEQQPQQPSFQHQESNYSAQSQYSQPPAGYGQSTDDPSSIVHREPMKVAPDTVISNADFLSRVSPP